MRDPLPMYKDGEETLFVTDEKRIQELQGQGYSRQHIPRDWPRIAYDSTGNSYSVHSSAEADAKGLSFDRPPAPPEPLVIPGSSDPATKGMVFDLEKRVAELEGQLDLLTAPKPKSKSKE